MTDQEYFLDQVRQAAISPHSTVNRILGITHREWTGSFSIGDFTDAVCRQTSMAEMRRFYRGKIEWYRGGGNSPQDATRKAADDIGSVLRDLGWWRRLKWWLATDITKSDICHA